LTYKLSYKNIFLFLPHIVIYIALIALSMEVAADRDNYLFFFEYPEESRFEYLYIQIGVFFKGWGISPTSSILIMQASVIGMFFVSFVKLSSSKGLLSISILTFLLFSVFATMLGMQLRFGFAVALSLLIFSYVKDRNMVFHLLYILPGMAHFGVIPFLITLLFYKLLPNLSRKVFFIFLLVVVLAVSVLTSHLPALLDLNDYYTSYFSGDLKTSLRPISFSLVYYLSIVVISLYFLRKDDFNWLGYAGLVFALASMLTGVSLLLKFMTPFSLILTMYLAENIESLNIKGKLETTVIAYLLSFFSLVYFAIVIQSLDL